MRGAERLAQTLRNGLDDALLFRRLATLVRDAPVSRTVDDLQWTGPRDDFDLVAAILDAPDFLSRAAQVSAARREPPG